MGKAAAVVDGAATDGAVVVDLDSVRTRLRRIQADLGAVYRERADAILCIMLAALCNEHPLLVGPPGTGKSALFYGFLASFRDARKFLTLVTKYGTEDEMFGPVKLSALRNDQWERNLEGRLAGVECAFLDEVFKGSDSVLNTLLSAMNERLYKGKRIPLRMMVGASNELPAEEILAAVYDRFLLRDVVEYVENDSAWMDLVGKPPTYTPSVFLTLAEWSAAVDAAAALPLPEKVVREMLRLRKELKGAKGGGITVSDRRWIALTRVLRAAAWLDGAKEVELDHLEVLKFGLWQKPADRASVKAVLQTVDRGVVGQAAQIVDEALVVFSNRTRDAARRREELPKIATTIEKAAARVNDLLASGITKRAHDRIKPKLDELTAANTQVKAEMREVYSL